MLQIKLGIGVFRMLSIIEGAAYSIEGAAYSIEGAAYSIEGAAYSIEGAAYSLQNNSRNILKSILVIKYEASITL